MIDLATCLAGERPVRVAAAGTRALAAGGAEDDVSLTLAMSGGSLATIVYHATGDPASPKERVEAVRGDRLVVIEDFRGILESRDGKAVRAKLPADKGHAAGAKAFVDALRAGGPPPIPYEDLVAVTRATFAARRSLESGRFEVV